MLLREKKMPFKNLLVILLISIPAILYSQNIREWQNLRVVKQFQDSIGFKSIPSADLLFSTVNDTFPYSNKKFHHYIFNFNLGRYESDNLVLDLLPPVNYSIRYGAKGGESRAKFGGLIIGRYKKKLKFYTGFTEDRIHIQDFLKFEKSRLFPGHSLLRVDGDGEFNFSDSYSRVVYDVNDNFSFTIANDKAFIGEGYHSLFLSDYSKHHPFVNVTFKNQHFFYESQFHILSNVHRGDSFYYQKKGGVFRRIGVNYKNFEGGLFSGIIWSIQDSTGIVDYKPEYIFPVLFLRPVEYSLGSRDNAVLGAWFNYTFKKIKIYSQVVVDDLNVKQSLENPSFFQNKIGYQIGAKALFNDGSNNYYFLLEHNLVRPYTYAHKFEELNYSNYGSELAHPLGANFWDVTGVASWNNYRYGANVVLSYSQKGYDLENNSYGGNIFNSDFNSVNGLLSASNPFLQGDVKEKFTFVASLDYILNPSQNLKLQLGYQNSNEAYFFFKLKSNLDFHFTEWLN